MTKLKPRERLNMQQALNYWEHLKSAYETEQLTMECSKSKPIALPKVTFQRQDTPTPNRASFFNQSKNYEIPQNTYGPLLMCHTL